MSGRVVNDFSKTTVNQIRKYIHFQNAFAPLTPFLCRY